MSINDIKPELTYILAFIYMNIANLPLSSFLKNKEKKC